VLVEIELTKMILRVPIVMLTEHPGIAGALSFFIFRFFKKRLNDRRREGKEISSLLKCFEQIARVFAMVMAHRTKGTAPWILPGNGLIRFSKFFCSAKSFEQVFEPTILDLQLEYSNALSQGKRWKARGCYIRGCCAFWKTVLFFGVCSAVTSLYRRATKA
jgi:hypothetical protein